MLNILEQIKLTTLKSLEPGDRVRVGYGHGEQNYAVAEGNVMVNAPDQKVLALMKEDGNPALISYSVVQTVDLLEKGKGGHQTVEVKSEAPKAVPAVEAKVVSYHNREMTYNGPDTSDGTIRGLFGGLPREEKARLNGVADRFFFGVKNQDRVKIKEAAASGRKILLDDYYDKQYDWSVDAARMVGLIQCRAGQPDAESFLVGEQFADAAWCAFRKQDWSDAGVYAAVALLKGQGTDRKEDLLIILAQATVKCGDAAAAAAWLKRNAGTEAGKVLLSGLLREKGADLNLTWDRLAEHYTAHDMNKELEFWYADGEPTLEEESQEKSQETTPPPAPVKKNVYTHIGRILRLSWADHTGTILGDDGKQYSFRYPDIANPGLRNAIGNCFRADLGGKVYWVRFSVSGGAAKNIQSAETALFRAKKAAVNLEDPQRYLHGMELCRASFGTPDELEALSELMQYSLEQYRCDGVLEHLENARRDLEQREKMISDSGYQMSATVLSSVAQIYQNLNHPNMAMEYTSRALEMKGLPFRLEMTLLAQYTRHAEQMLEEKADTGLARMLEEKAQRWMNLYNENNLSGETMGRKVLARVTERRVKALCLLDKPDQASDALALMPGDFAKKADVDRLEALVAETRRRIAPQKPEPQPQEAVCEDILPAEPEEAEEQLLPAEPVNVPAGNPEPEQEEEEEEPIESYVDGERMDAAGMSAAEILSYAMNIRGEGAISGLLAWLKAGAMLRPEVERIYRAAALAADDPMGAADYSVDTLVEELGISDRSYAEFRELCMAAAYLRHCFTVADSSVYGVDALRGSVTALERIEGMEELCDRLAGFRREAMNPMDIYARYRTRSDRELEEELAAVQNHAGELYTRLVLTPPRLDAKMARWVETKRILFSRESFLGQVLEALKDGDRNRLAQQKEEFAALCRIRGAFAGTRLGANAVDSVMTQAWDEAGKLMPSRKPTATPQGNLGNNLRSNVSETLNLIFRFYAIMEQSTGLSGRSEAGKALYERSSGSVVELLRNLERSCLAEADKAEGQNHLGMRVIAMTAGELADKLEGTWTEDRRKFFYADFLRTGEVLLDEAFQPELSATFCALEEFNILERIRRHLEHEKMSFQQRLDRIYGRERQEQNYGVAEQIMAYAESGLCGETVRVPENPELFREQSEKQVKIQLRIFRENYALALSCGQIERSDDFCYRLENTVRYWLDRWGSRGNYGFALRLMEQGEAQIRRSARRYEKILLEQLDALIAAGAADFVQHPEHIEAIRDQISHQNFLVAEDWMNQARQGRLHIDREKREALGYLEEFWSNYAALYKQVADPRRSLKSQVGSRSVHNRDSKGTAGLIDAWLGNGGPTPMAKISALLNLLGWKNVQVEPFRYAGDPRAELFCVTRQHSDQYPEAPVHPIASFGSRITRDGMYAACLYGSHDSNRIYEKIRAMDALSGSKVVFVDCALGSTERRLLARKLKRRDSGLSNTYLVIDRVMLLYLANRYHETLINRIVMAVGMPFSYDQPYVADSSHTMPPEIFIGRKDELRRIKDPDGVNLIYGGRQLGKSALLKKALAEVDGIQKGRAVLLDLKDCGCADGAKKLCWELMDVGILPEEPVTEDWDELCRRIRRRLRREDEPIRYLLVLLDEADAFISDCARVDYKPLVALKGIQQIMDGRFKFVLAGLHDVIRFNRAVALGRNGVITHLPSMKITPFRPAEAEELLTDPLSYLGFSMDSPVTVSQILATANYFPGLIQLCGQKLIESVREADYAGYDMRSTPPYAVSDSHLRRIMADREFTDQIREKFEITLRLDDGYYPLVLLIGWMYYIAPSGNGYSPRDVLAQAEDLHLKVLTDMGAERISALMQELQDLNILRSIDRDTYLLASKNFRDLLGTEEEICEKLNAMGGAKA